MRILILGDGNFSFSLALYKSLDYLCSYLGSSYSASDSHIDATSFDDLNSLLSKYPETKHIIQFLQSKDNCQILHEINATRQLYHQLMTDQPYDHIIFNFPHLGVENELLHSNLLGHILYRYYGSSLLHYDIILIIYIAFHRCAEATIDGNVYISLAEDQARRWRL